ncbi:AAA family ATPase [Bacillus velezensis]
MNVYIKSILAFNKEGEKRHVDLTDGLNVITGESKSGKSALLEIIDYCLGSSKPTIPKGEVTKFGYLFVLILKFPHYHLVIARKRFDNGGKKQMYLYRTSQDIIPRELSMKLFTEEYALNFEQAKIELSKELGISVSNSTENINATKSDPRPTVRNMTSYMFQHQNLVASKFALFYRFEDSQKREQTIKQFPVFAGWVDQQYYNYRLELDDLLKQKKRNEKLQTSYNKSVEIMRKSLLNTFKRYYMLVGKNIDDSLTLYELLRLRKRLPDFTKESYLSEEMERRYEELRKQREELKQQRYDIEMSISNLELSHDYGQSYSSNLKSLKAILNHSLYHSNSYDCPVCGQKVKTLSKKILSLNDSRKWLVNELSSVKGQRNEFHLQIHRLTRKKR